MRRARPILVDLFCKAGGCSMGYFRAGFDVIGVDIEPQPRYPFRFILADALNPPMDWSRVDAVHASPPCQGYSLIKNRSAVKRRPLLIPTVREMLKATGLPWVIENVEGAARHMPAARLLCGASFGLGIKALDLDLARHRLFESSVTLLTPPCSHRRGRTVGVYGHGTNEWHRSKLGRNITMAERREAMQIDWMRRGEDSEAIPPAYTEFIGKQLLRGIQ